MNIEPLEPRIAPAALFVNATTATYIDVDGDLVTVKFSKPILTAANIATVLVTAPVPLGNIPGDQLQKIDLHSFLLDRAAEGTSITVTAKPQDANGDTFIDGDGLANVGSVEAGPSGFVSPPGLQLGAINIRGDLGNLEAGSNIPGALSVKSLTVVSLGRFDLSTGASDLESGILGRIGAVTVATSVTCSVFYAQDFGTVKIGGFLRGTLASAANIASLQIGGNLEGDITANSPNAKVGSLQIGGSFTSGQMEIANLGSLKIAGDMRASSGDSATVHANLIGSVTIGGSLVGAGSDSGRINAGVISGAVKIGGDLVGGTGTDSGQILAPGGIGKVEILGSVLGGGSSSGMIRSSSGPIKTLKIGHDLRGGSAVAGTNDPTPVFSGYVEAVGIGSMSVGGSIVAGRGQTVAGTDLRNGSVRSDLAIGSLMVKGDVAGNTEVSLNRAIVSARSQYPAGTVAKSDLTVGKISIGGTLENADLLAGYSAGLIASNPDAQVGSVTVGGDWVASNLVAGIYRAANGFGDGDDAKIPNLGQANYLDNDDAKGAVSKIASVVIKGSAIGTLAFNDAAVFGIEAQHIVSIKVGGATEKLKAGRSNDIFTFRDPLGATLTNDGTGDFRAFEVA